MLIHAEWTINIENGEWDPGIDETVEAVNNGKSHWDGADREQIEEEVPSLLEEVSDASMSSVSSTLFWSQDI
jgi:hypothetical protein